MPEWQAVRTSSCSRRSLYDIDKVIEKIEDRDKKGCRFTIIAVAEGAISRKMLP